MSDWSKPYVNLAYKIGFVQGFENKDGTLSFRPKETTDRQDAARLTYEFIVNIAKYMEKKANELTKPAAANPKKN